MIEFLGPRPAPESGKTRWRLRNRMRRDRERQADGDLKSPLAKVVVSRYFRGMKNNRTESRTAANAV